MKVEDLRLGNLVAHKHVKEFTVTGIHKLGIAVTSETTNGTYQIDELLPIPLTEDWLVRFGFEKKEYHLILKTEYLFTIRHTYGLKGVRLLGYKDKIFGKWIYYVHELQNSFHALTGKELELSNQNSKL